MAKTFKQFCEAQDSTVFHNPQPSDSVVGRGARPFENVVDPLIKEFIQKIFNNTINEHNQKLDQSQIQYIVQSITNQLGKLQYQPKDQGDLGSMINNLWRAGNRPQRTTQNRTGLGGNSTVSA